MVITVRKGEKHKSGVSLCRLVNQSSIVVSGLSRSGICSADSFFFLYPYPMKLITLRERGVIRLRRFHKVNRWPH